MIASHLNLVDLTVILFACFAFSKADQQFNCPNNGLPKMDEALGRPIQCLPGQSSEPCGKGFSCFFSGFNYQCCPTAEDSPSMESNQNDHCPTGSYLVLNSHGSAMKCDPLQGCPKVGMFCSTLKSPPTCCEIFGTVRSSTNKDGAKGPLAEGTKIEPISGEGGTTKYPDGSFSCPEDSIPVLSTSGEMIRCTSDNSEECKAVGAFCHQTVSNETICCHQEGENSVIQSNSSEKRGSKLQHVVDFDSGKKKSSLLESVRRSPLVSNSYHFADNEAENNAEYQYQRQMKSRRKIHEGYAKARAAKIKEVDPIFDLSQENPVANKLQRINTYKLNVEQKMKAQRFLVEQIKNGWPYNDKFYRPEDVAIIRKGSHPTAIIHFPSN